MAKFTVDTHLFRELGDLLVGRDSTALVELIKNSYDADATFVSVYGEALDDVDRGFIQVTDDGVGMTDHEFEEGFLRIASRTKDQGDRVSGLYNRRYTGSKGIGRLAAHKLARFIKVNSVSRAKRQTSHCGVVDASIDWDMVESQETLDDIEGTSAIRVGWEPAPADIESGTVITLRRLRRKWTATELGRFLLEAQTFAPPPVAVELPKGVLAQPLLFSKPRVRDTTSSDPGFDIILEGEFEPGEDYWQNLAQAANWVIEIDALSEPGDVLYTIAPTQKTLHAYSDAKRRDFCLEHPDSRLGPFFQARILVREGQSGSRQITRWARRASGIRVFLEGFRVLPYGEPRNDWLGLDADYTHRSRTLKSLQGTALEQSFTEQDEDTDAGLTILGNNSYFGAVFLTQAGASSLRMLVNREGFVPEAAFDTLTDLVRKGVDLSTRVRASAKFISRLERREQRAAGRTEEERTSIATPPIPFNEAVEQSVARATALTSEAKQLVATGDAAKAAEKLSYAIAEVERASQMQDSQISETAMLRVVASVGTQMAAFIHEINGLLGMTQSIDAALSRMRKESSLPRGTRRELARLHAGVGQLQRSLERHASYLIDVVTPDSRRRRVRQSLAERFDAGRRLVDYMAEKRRIKIINEILPDLKSPPMFPAELTAVFSNLLTNAVKAAGSDGTIRAVAERRPDGTVALVIQNTGVAVDLPESERWFMPFESTTTAVDPILGQGMGLGLPITRSMLEEYGADIKFVDPAPGYATAIEIVFPE
jgi:signal transduction histidine kinase